ncbi:M56 family metallopeptidase [Kitasatospora sp. NBC_01539]|uniref:M56 family metallopeptidase n=1 Tax=Kitasatospora sp. NBC_01539 TaxID=2903577 RepID=UPI0038602904
MSALALLAALTAAAGWWVPGRLARAAWTVRAPGAAIALWCALMAFCAMAVAMGLHRLSAGHDRSAGLLGWITGRHGRVAEGLAGHVEAVVLAAAVFGAAGTVVAAGWVKAARARRRHRELLDLVARPGAGGTLVVDDSRAAAWCLPGRGGRVVLTRGADEQLTAGQRRAVLAHERAHLAGRHHLVLASVAALGRALDRLPLARLAAQRVPVLCEMAADDAAVRVAGRGAVAQALCRVAGGAAPAGALAAGAHGVVERLRRLTAVQPALSVPARVVCWGVVLVLPVVPVLVACGP